MSIIIKKHMHVMALIARIRTQLKVRYPLDDWFPSEIDKIEKAWKAGKISEVSDIGQAAVQVIDDHTDQLANDLCELSSLVRSAYAENKDQD